MYELDEDGLAVIDRKEGAGWAYERAPVMVLPEGEPPEVVGPPLPDVREQDGWVFQSQPVFLRRVPGGTEIDRVRQAVSPSGELTESYNTILLDDLAPEELESDARATGFRVCPRRAVPGTRDYVGSTVVVLEAP